LERVHKKHRSPSRAINEIEQTAPNGKKRETDTVRRCFN